MVEPAEDGAENPTNPEEDPEILIVPLTSKDEPGFVVFIPKCPEGVIRIRSTKLFVVDPETEPVDV